MSFRRFNLKPNNEVTPCPECKNNTKFTGHSQQCAEDYCNVWIECECGFDPTAWDKMGSMYRVESVWGGVDSDNIWEAIGAWNDAIQDYLEKISKTKPELLLAIARQGGV